MIQTPYKCRFCQKEGIAWASDDSNPEWNTTFAKMLSCNNCADYRRRYVRYRDAIEKTCLQIVTARKTLSPEKCRQIEENKQLSLETLTKSFSHVVCKHHAIVDCWEQEFVNLLMEKPEKAWTILCDFESRIKHDREIADENESKKLHEKKENYNDALL